VWFHHAELSQKLLEPIPIVAPTLAAPIEILPHLTNSLVVEKLQTSQVAMHAKVLKYPVSFVFSSLNKSGKRRGGFP
jgi:hypothetical protein